MTEEFQAPAWVEAAFAEARGLMAEANARWAATLGDPGLFGGFQVEPGVEQIDGKDELRYSSTLYGGRSFVGTAEEVRAAQRTYIVSRAKPGRKTAA